MAHRSDLTGVLHFIAKKKNEKNRRSGDCCGESQRLSSRGTARRDTHDKQTRTTNSPVSQLVRKGKANCRQGPRKDRFEEASKNDEKVFLPRVQKKLCRQQVQFTKKLVK